MAYASRSGRARTSPGNPAAFAVCDRCSRWYNHKNLRWQYQYRGPVVQNIRLLVCADCYDALNYQSKAIILPADPLPVVNARIEYFQQYETDQRVTAAPPVIDPETGIPIPQGQPLVTPSGDSLITQPTGAPNEIELAAVQTTYKKVAYGPTLSVITALGDGNYTVTVNCSAAHGLGVNSQIVSAGLTSPTANGDFNVSAVPSAMDFSYTTQKPDPSGVLWSTGSAIWTANVGLPYGMTQFPQTGM